MSTLTWKRGAGLGRGLVVAASVFAAAVLNSYSHGGGVALGGPYLWASIGVAIPVAFTLAVLAQVQPQTALLGLVGIVVFNAVLAYEVAVSAGPQPLPLALGAVVVAGMAMVLAGRARFYEVMEGVAISWIGCAVIFELSIVLVRVLVSP